MLSKTEEKFEVDLELNVEIKLKIRFKSDMEIEFTSLLNGPFLESLKNLK